MDDEEPDLPPVRRPKAFHSEALEAIDLSVIDWGTVQTWTVEELEALGRRPVARLRRLVGVPRRWARERLARRRLARQRASRGWTDTELWNLDTHLCQHLGSLLARHVTEARNHPPEIEFEEWIGQVRVATEGLLAYDPRDAERVAAARAALHWAADNLVDLRD